MMAGKRKPIGDRLWPKIATTPFGCWEWTATKNSYGYGRIWDGDRLVLAHRAVWEVLIAPLSDDVDLDHLCRNPGCVNPAHLQPVDHRENVLRGTSIPAENARKTECVNGHEFTPENTIIRTPPSRNHPTRACRICKNASNRKWKRNRRAMQEMGS